MGAVSFLNTRPLVCGLDDDPRVELQYAVPSALPGLLAEGRVDAALIPVIDLARNADKWERVSDSCIASDGRTLTVRVFSKVPPDRMEVLHVDPDSHTSVALARLIWKHVYRRPLRIEPAGPAEDLRNRESVLLIGDKVATTPMLWFDYHVDLGDAWKKWTGLPFVFAVWARRKDRENEAATGRRSAAEIARILETARDQGTARAAEIGAEYGPKRDWPTALAVEYLTRALMFKLTPAALAGMNRYIELVTEAGLISPGSSRGA
ncbi:MAG TPA: menaquinone biosynthesis protein [Phycisphaerae bacterium]|nr:menaquinone biosynthesis protein [Phycisphaerae bacterium]HOJ72800.1 menaquinone biosynthesis protein [Phycisphaerae bacterium]HOM51773.1 menaquinone biosynthesis protein [Phycisphaerae bacterium]HON66777.1 menaquinone biosynthesis protein [Phycisphaerae bacterium]HOQ86335.1 menaquinone biosynthesis protein [Phycisphaerae bacterium]